MIFTDYSQHNTENNRELGVHCALGVKARWKWKA